MEPKSKLGSRKANTQKRKRATSSGSLERLVRKWGSYEVRLNDDKTIDEIVAENVEMFHLEQMDDGCWWIGLNSRGGQMMRIYLFNKRNAAIACNAESEDGKISEGFGTFSNNQAETRP